MDNYVYVLFEADNSGARFPPSVIPRLCKDPASWWNVMRVLAGYSDHIIMDIDAERENTTFSTRMAVFFERPPNGWRFPPETA